MKKSTPFSNVDGRSLSGIRGVAFDIDDTLSTHGFLTAEAYAALWALKRAGFYLVPITGRPAGWCDHFARFWPVDAIVGENGAFTFFMQDGIRRRFVTPGGDPNRDEKIANLRQALIREFPGMKFASDQNYRENDLAIDFCEDVPAWPRAEVDRLVALCEREGAHVKVSRIHVNTCYGVFDKRLGFEAWAKAGAPGMGREFPTELAVPKLPQHGLGLAEWIFVGDSPNDEPMFRYFQHSVGVANLANFLDRLTTPPTYITSLPSGAGFVQVAEKLLTSR